MALDLRKLANNRVLNARDLRELYVAVMGKANLVGTAFTGPITVPAAVLPGEAVNKRQLDAKGIVSVTDAQFGGVGDTTTDDSTALQAALTAVPTGGTLQLPAGKTFRATSALSRTGSIRLAGGGTILFDFTGGPGITFSGATAKVQVEDVILDGNAKCGDPLYFNGVAQAHLERVTVQNVDSATSARGVIMDTVPFWTALRSKVKTVHALANGTQGDANGSCIGLYATGTIELGLVAYCEFDDINNRDSGGAKSWEDADAVSIAGISNESQVVHVVHNRFNDCGKRACKFNSANTDCQSEFSDNKIISTFTGTVDDGTTIGNGMFACCFFSGGILHAHRNRVGKPNTPTGVISYFIEGNGTSIVAAFITKNYYYPEYHVQANTVNTRFISLIGLTSFSKVHEESNHCENITEGTYTNAKYYYNRDSLYNVIQNGINLLGPTNVFISGCDLQYLGGSSSACGIIMADGLVTGHVADCSFHGHTGNAGNGGGAIVVKTQTGPPAKVALDSNIFDAVTGDKYNVPASAPWLWIDGDNLPATTTASSFTPDGSGTRIFDYTANANATINAPTKFIPGRVYTFILRENGTGNFAWTWNAAYTFAVAAWSNTGNTASKVSSVQMLALTATTARQVTAQAPFA